MNSFSDARAVSVVVTHDIPYNDVFRHQIMEQTNEKPAYTYLLGRKPGIKFHEKMLGQPCEGLASNGHVLLFHRGQKGVVGINKCGYTGNFTVSTSDKFYWTRNCRNALTDSNTNNIKGSPFQHSLTGRTGLSERQRKVN
jgi:alpha-amylase